MTRFGVAPEFNTTKLVYRDLAFGRQEYAYHQWRGTPQALVADYLRRDMQKSGLFMAVAGPNSSMPATHQLEGVVEEWMELDQAERWLASAELTIILLDVRTGGYRTWSYFNGPTKRRNRVPKKSRLSGRSHEPGYAEPVTKDRHRRARCRAELGEYPPPSRVFRRWSVH